MKHVALLTSAVLAAACLCVPVHAQEAPAPDTATVAAEITPVKIFGWIDQALAASFSHNPTTIDESIARAADSFYTAQGKENYQAALRRIGFPARLKNSELTVRPSFPHTPKLKDASAGNWQVDVPLLLEFFEGAAADSPKASQGLLLSLMLVPSEVTAEKPMGLAIDTLTIVNDPTHSTAEWMAAEPGNSIADQLRRMRKTRNK